MEMLHQRDCRLQRRLARWRAQANTLAQPSVAPKLISVLVVAGAALLCGCSTTLNNGMESGLVSDAPTPAAVTETAAIPTPGATPEHRSSAANTNSKNTELSRVADKFTSIATPGSADYKIGPQDVLDISVFKVPELTRSVQVADAGTINLPLVGEVTATGKTAREIEHDLATKLGAKYLQSPQVTVYIKEYNSQRVTLDGAVKKPGVYPIRGKTTLMQAVALAEGLNDIADSSCIVVFRLTGDKRTASTL